MSKELEALETIKNAPTIYVGCGSNIYTRYPFECKLIETALKDFVWLKSKLTVDFYDKLPDPDRIKLLKILCMY